MDYSRYYIIYYIRDEMLKQKVDADLAWEVARLAEKEEYTYKVLLRWMEEPSDTHLNRLKYVKEYLNGNRTEYEN